MRRGEPDYKTQTTGNQPKTANNDSRISEHNELNLLKENHIWGIDVLIG